jgi:hemoglobin
LILIEQLRLGLLLIRRGGNSAKDQCKKYKARFHIFYFTDHLVWNAILVATPVDDQEIFPLIGEDGFVRLIAAFYRQVPHDALLGPMYAARDLAEAEARLRDFLIYRFGGPPRYIEQRGHPRLRMRHAPFTIGQAARDRWIQLMNNALAEAAFPVEAEALLREFFAGTATFMINRPDL